MTAFGIERDPRADTQAMADRVMGAAQAWSNGYKRSADTLIGALVEDTRGRYDRDRAGWAVQSILADRITLGVNANWQPVDLDRLVARSAKDATRALLGDAMAYHLSAYGRTTVDPDWWAQMENISASMWWPGDQPYPSARAHHEPWSQVLRAAVELIAIVWALPQIEKLGPAPGERHHRVSSTRHVEPKILERVRRLLAKAESTTFEAEAETFTAGAQALMARHSIDAALLSASEQSTDGPAMRRIGVSAPYESPKVSLLNGIAAANRSRAIWSQQLGFVTVIGHREDLDAIETLFTSLLVQATTTMTRQGTRTDELGRSRTAAFRRSFLEAFAVRISERLHEAAHDEVVKVTEEQRGGSGGGQALVPLLEQRREAVDQVVDEHFPDLRKKRPTTVSDGEGWFSGQAAADRASLSGAKSVDGRGR